MSIQILSSEIINQIAAGEVVERPAHLIKELIENSLDASATQITVEITNGGRFVRVIDNGHGILSSELGSALQRHATSKIRKTADLWNLNTFGFRGEALASAAAVSQLTLKSFHRDEKKPSSIESNFGALSDVKPAALTRGTEILIESLFENVPARLKFLRSESTEAQQVKLVVKALALAHHEVEFKLLNEGELQLFLPKKNSKLERVQDILEKKSFFESQNQKGSMKCHVVFSSPHEVAKTSKQIWIFAQNRWIQDRAIQAAVMDAYRSLLMHGEYPHAVVWLECDPAEIDVNIHPTKSQIKFQDPSAAFRIVHHTLRDALERAPWISSYQPATQRAPEVVQENLKLNDHRFEQTHFKNKSFNLNDLTFLKVEHNNFLSNAADQKSDQGTPQKSYWSQLQIIGQANLTYIVCQKEDRLVFVDQHAAHERVVYEKLMESWKNKKFEIQDYLFPLAIDLSEDKVEVLLAAKADIESLGFEIEQLGPQVLGVKAAPHLIKDGSLPAVFDKMAQDLLINGGSFAIEKKISDLFATMACHSVVRAGQSLSREEMHELLVSMDQYSLSSFCPHGRPVSVEKSFNELEKLFGRIN
ncbi:MAG: DNA mismatch repair endonuclease MutL [Bdellovibrionaceae bacterium]|nr:DNA mismatch repair endonuclease MutL [Bdellovibrio sp.]